MRSNALGKSWGPERAIKTRISFLLICFQENSNGSPNDNQKDPAAQDDGQDTDEFDVDDEVEFDEHGGVITDKETLKKIKHKKRKHERRCAKAKRKCKKKHKKKQKKKDKDKEHRRRERKRSKHDESDDDEDGDHEKNSKRARLAEVEDGELTLSSSSISSSESCDEEDGAEDCTNNTDDGVPMFKAAGRFQGVLEIRVFILLFN